MADKVPLIPPPIDLSCLGPDVTEEELRNIGKKIIEGFHHSGYVYLNNHVLHSDYIKNVYKATDQFFDLEEDFKIKFKRSMTTYHGYSNEKHEQLYKTISIENKTKRDTFDVTGFEGLPFPDKEVPALKESTKKLSDIFLPTVYHLLRSLELEFGLKAKFLVNKHKSMMNGDNATDLRSIRYLPPDREEQVNRLGAHVDFTTFTFHLFHDLDGLQFLSKDEEWQNVVLHPGCIMLFPGEFIQMWTVDDIKALKHRVILPKNEESRNQIRHAMVIFVVPDTDTVIEPFDNSKTQEPILVADIVKNRSQVFQKVLYNY